MPSPRTARPAGDPCCQESASSGAGGRASQGLPCLMAARCSGALRAALALAVLTASLAGTAAQIAATPVRPAAAQAVRGYVPAAPVAAGYVPAAPVAAGAAPVTGGVPAAQAAPSAVVPDAPVSAGVVPAAPVSAGVVPAAPVVGGAPAAPVAGAAPTVPGVGGAAAAANSSDDDYAPPNPDPLGIGGDASQPLINPRNPLNLGGSLISAPLGGSGGGSVRWPRMRLYHFSQPGVLPTHGRVLL